MSSAIDLYDALLNAESDRERARILANAFDALEERFPALGDLATRTDLSETELRLRKEIEQVRKEIEQVRRETEQIRGEIKALELKLSKEIEEVRGEVKALELKTTKEIEQLRVDLAETKVSILRWVAGFILAQGAGIVWVILRVSGH